MPRTSNWHGGTFSLLAFASVASSSGAVRPTGAREASRGAERARGVGIGMGAAAPARCSRTRGVGSVGSAGGAAASLRVDSAFVFRSAGCFSCAAPAKRVRFAGGVWVASGSPSSVTAVPTVAGAAAGARSSPTAAAFSALPAEAALAVVFGSRARSAACASSSATAARSSHMRFPRSDASAASNPGPSAPRAASRAAHAAASGKSVYAAAHFCAAAAAERAQPCRRMASTSTRLSRFDHSGAIARGSAAGGARGGSGV